MSGKRTKSKVNCAPVDYWCTKYLFIILLVILIWFSDSLWILEEIQWWIFCPCLILSDNGKKKKNTFYLRLIFLSGLYSIQWILCNIYIIRDVCNYWKYGGIDKIWSSYVGLYETSDQDTVNLPWVNLEVMLKCNKKGSFNNWFL